MKHADTLDHVANYKHVPVPTPIVWLSINWGPRLESTRGPYPAISWHVHDNVSRLWECVLKCTMLTDRQRVWLRRLVILEFRLNFEGLICRLFDNLIVRWCDRTVCEVCKRVTRECTWSQLSPIRWFTVGNSIRS